jgi:hypothetical protein
MLSGKFGGTQISTPESRAVTKVERAVESIEALANAVYTLREKPDDDRAAAHRDVIDARAECAEALKDFLAPTLRVVQ